MGNSPGAQRFQARVDAIDLIRTPALRKAAQEQLMADMERYNQSTPEYARRLEERRRLARISELLREVEPMPTAGGSIGFVRPDAPVVDTIRPLLYGRPVTTFRNFRFHQLRERAGLPDLRRPAHSRT